MRQLDPTQVHGNDGTPYLSLPFPQIPPIYRFLTALFNALSSPLSKQSSLLHPENGSANKGRTALQL